MLRHILQAGLTFCLVSVAFATDHTERSTYGIPDTCTCGFDTLPEENAAELSVTTSATPDHQDLGISADCLPDIEDNTRVCFRTRVKECTNDRGGVDYHCRLFYNNFTNEPLPQSCESAVFLSPPQTPTTRPSACFE
ncbi:hypothetical protein GBAR_LOCUS8914 [Geodia barretti]|uniref:Uncharacterized protein n=1 Tax=Geodia barretti TaxID=519541 RepID=A0AA35WHS5_GEOBA|nr:hypothetical protein GBAR_LOCUS8914 [Geodia barretti]